ncbi:MAG: hypothetical protein SGPRY_010516 [Prymnesium sp.]
MDTHNDFWLHEPDTRHTTNKAPGAVACARLGRPDPHLVIALHDNKSSRQHGSFTDEDKGKLFLCCMIIMEHFQPTREFLPCSLFDGKYAQCYKVVRSKGSFRYCADWSPQLDLSRQGDAQLYAGFLMDYNGSGYNVSPLHQQAGAVLGHGGTSVVFQHLTQDDCVIKVPYLSHWSHERLQHERSILERLGDEDGMLHILPDDDGSECLLLRPKFELIGQDSLLPLYVTLIDEQGHLRRLHKKGVVHCDVRPANIMKAVGNTQRAVLVDFSAACSIENEADVYTHGTLSFASDRVLQAVHGNEKIKVTPTDDMQSFARCILASMFNINDFALHTHDTCAIQECWAKLENRTNFSKKLMDLCYANPPDYDAVCTFLREAIPSKHHM